jgi:branched-chain amino acid transport system permease protein
MLQYIFAGLALGAIYAIASASIVVTYVSAGVLNFAFGSLAFAVARVYYWALVEMGWSLVPAALFSLLVFAPLLGAFLWAVLFRFLRLQSSLIKIVATIGLSVAIPPVVNIVLGDVAVSQAPGLAPRPVRVFNLFGAAVNADQLITLGFLVVILVAGTAVLRFTDVGLRVRAMVDSEALTSLSGTSPSLVSLGVWSATTVLAGLAGILVAPTNGLSVGGMSVLMVAAFAAVVAARLTSLPLAIAIALAMGVLTTVVQKYLPPDSTLTGAVVPSIPFAVIVIFLLYYALRGQVSDIAGTGGALDNAIRPAGEDASTSRPSARGRTTRTFMPIATIVVIALIPAMLKGYWLGLFAAGIIYGVIFLSFTLVTGEGGMIWLCQITFSGVGAIGTAQLATNYGWSPLAAAIGTAVIAVPIGLLLGLLTIRLGDLYVALVTLSFGLLMSTLVFTRAVFYQFGVGVTADRPEFAFSDRYFAYFALTVFVVFSFLVYNLRRSTSGLALSAVRWSPNAAKTMGISAIGVKILAVAVATFVAAIGGALLAMYNGVASPDTYTVFAGLIWLAVVVTNGVRSTTAALVAGLAFSLLPGLFSQFVSGHWLELPALLFGLGAVLVAVNPDGVIAMNGRQLDTLLDKIPGRKSSTGPTASVREDAGSAAVDGPESSVSKQPATPLTTANGVSK